jgi:hypothetical protein
LECEWMEGGRRSKFGIKNAEIIWAAKIEKEMAI